MEDNQEMSSAHESELGTLKAELDRKGPALPNTEAECVRLRSRVVGLEDELADLTRRFAALDHTWDEERDAHKASRAKASRVDGLALELVQAKAYIHSTLSMEYGREDNEPSELLLASHRLHTELAKREEALRVDTTEVGTLRALLETKR